MKSKRFFLGVVPDFAELENRFVMGAFTDPTPLRLGTAVDDEDASTIVSVFETISSRSRIVLEGYTRCVVSDLGMMLAGEVQYTPRAHAKLVAAHNARFETNFPEDMPVDVIAALMGMPVLSREGLLAQIAAEPDAGGDQPLFLMALALVLMDPDEVEKAISPYAEHRELHVRQSVASLARSFGLRALIERMAPREQDEELRAMLEEALSEDEDEDEGEGEDEDEDEDEDEGGDGQA